MGAGHLAGAHPIIALDRFDNQLELARALGATHTINVNRADAAAEMRGIVGHDGVDVAVDNTGNVDVIALASRLTNGRGRTVLVGVPPKDSTAANAGPTSTSPLRAALPGGPARPAKRAREPLPSHEYRAGVYGHKERTPHRTSPRPGGRRPPDLITPFGRADSWPDRATTCQP